MHPTIKIGRRFEDANRDYICCAISLCLMAPEVESSANSYTIGLLSSQ